MLTWCQDGRRVVLNSSGFASSDSFPTSSHMHLCRAAPLCIWTLALAQVSWACTNTCVRGMVCPSLRHVKRTSLISCCWSPARRDGANQHTDMATCPQRRSEKIEKHVIVWAFGPKDAMTMFCEHQFIAHEQGGYRGSERTVAGLSC
jgi:hypothetical protein